MLDLRPSVMQSRMDRVQSLATTNKIFYWTNGKDVLYEEYHQTKNQYFHNSYPDLTERPYLKVLVNVSSAQPTPIPINPPTSVQVIFTSQYAKVKWDIPHLLGGQGKYLFQHPLLLFFFRYLS